MRVLVFGATGTAGGGIVRACLRSPHVSEVRAVVRRAPTVGHHALRIFVHDDYADDSAVRDAFAGVDACFYALGVSVRQVPGEAEYRRITHDFAVAAAVELKAGSPGAVLHFISGQGTRLDSRFMWARVKAETERDVARLVPTVCWRPGFIDGGAGTGPRLNRALRPVIRLLRFVPSLSVTSEEIGQAMIQAVTEGLREGVVENAGIRTLAARGQGAA